MKGSRSRTGSQCAAVFIAAVLVVTSRPQAVCQENAALQRESFRLDVPLLVAKQFENIRGLIEQEDWPRALTALEEVTEETPDALVAVEPGRYLNASRLATLLITQFPADGLAVYWERMDGWAEQRFEAAMSLQSEQELRTLLREAYASSYGDDALWVLGGWLWFRGEIDAARRAWEQLLPFSEDGRRTSGLRYPDSEFPAADVHARLVLCAIADQNPVVAERLLGEFVERYPEATGSLAGRSGLLSKILTEVIKSADTWPAPRTVPDWTTFAQEPARNAAVASDIRLDGPQWSIPLEPLNVPNWERNRPALPPMAPLGRYPVAVDGGLFFHDGASIRAVRVDDGQPLWPSDEENDVGDIYPPFNVLPIRPVLRPTVGVPRYTTTIEQGRLYALTGPSVLTLPESGLRASPTRLVCLDVQDGEGLLAWFQTADDLFAPGWMMTGTPVAAGDRLYVPLLRTEPQLEPAVACLNAHDGAVVWQRSIGQALTEPLEGRVQLGHQLLTLCDEQVFFSTDLGVVVALDAESGEIRWAVTYPSTPLSVTTMSEEASHGLLPPICSDGRLFVKPNDADELFSLDMTSGAILWRRQVPSRIVHLLGVHNSDLVVSGDQLWSLDPATGDVNWRFGFDDPAGYGYGRGAVAGNRVYWTTHDDLFVVERLTGRAMRRYPLKELLDLSGGHILLATGRLVIAGRDHITAFAISTDTEERDQITAGSPK